VKKIVKRVNRDKEANTAGRVPSKTLLKKKKRKQSETSKPSSVVKPHASLPLPLHTPKKAKVAIPTAPQKAERAVTPPGEERIFTPKVSENNSDSVTHSQQPLVSDPPLQELDSFVSHEPKSLRSLIVDEEEEFELGFDWTVEEQLDTMAPTKQQQSQDYAKLKKKYESQKAKLEKLKGELEDCHESMDNQGREIQRANEQVLELQKTVEASSAPEDTKNRLVSLSREVGTLKANLAIHAKNNEAFQKNEDKLLKEVQGLKERQTTLSGLKEKLEKELGDAQAQLQDLRSSSSGPQSQESAKKIAELEKKVKDLSAQKLTGPQKVIASLRNAADKLEEENKKLKEDLKNRSEVDGNGTMIGSLTKEVDSLKHQLRTVNRDKQRLEEELAEATTSRRTSTLNEDPDTSDVSAQALLAENKTLKTDKKKLEAALARCLQALKDGGKFMEEEVSGPVKKKVTNWIKEVGFHTTKFLSGEVHVNAFVKEVYDALCEHDADAAAWTDSSSPRYLPFPEFVRIYKKVIRTAVNNRRQYTQTQCLKAAIGTFYPK
jgi:myosin heavy subunit